MDLLDEVFPESVTSSSLGVLEGEQVVEDDRVLWSLRACSIAGRDLQVRI